MKELPAPHSNCDQICVLFFFPLTKNKLKSLVAHCAVLRLEGNADPQKH